MRRPTPLLLGAVLLSACLKDELPVPAHEAGDGEISQVCMGTGYGDQLWLDLRTGTVLATNPKTAWDLAFESDADGWHVLLNGSRLMTAWNVGPVDLAQPMDTTGIAAGFRIDASSGEPDSTAIGDWRGTGDVYIVDLGYTALGAWLGARKVRFTDSDAAQFTLESARLDGSDFRTTTVMKDPTRNYTCFHFENGVVPIEPASTTWDLVFTQYTHQFYEPYLAYIVTGVLSSEGTRAALVRDVEFGTVSLADTLRFSFSDHKDAIGYAWKVYSFESASYQIDNSITYIIQDEEGYFYKLRFLDFYSDQGLPGCPRFEVEPL